MLKKEYAKYCMEFTNEEIVTYLAKPLREKYNFEVHTLDEDDFLVDEFSEKQISCVTFDGKIKDTNFRIIFWGYKTSIFIDDETKVKTNKKKNFTFNEEFMFIDDDIRKSVGYDETYANIVYEGKLKNLSSKEILELFIEFILILNGTTKFEFEETRVLPMGEYEKNNYVVKLSNNTSEKKQITIENITFIINEE